MVALLLCNVFLHAEATAEFELATSSEIFKDLELTEISEDIVTLTVQLTDAENATIEVKAGDEVKETTVAKLPKVKSPG